MARSFWDDLWTGLRGIADWIGLGTAIDTLYIATKQSGQLSTAKVNNIINDLVREARKKGDNVVNQLNDRLTSLYNSVPKSSQYRDALARGITETQSKVNQAKQMYTDAEQHLTNAYTNSSNIDTLPETQKSENHGIGSVYETAAKNNAKQANKIFEDMEKLL